LMMVGKEREQFPEGNDGNMFQEHGFALNNAGNSTGWIAPTVWDEDKWFFHVDKEGGPHCHTSMAMGQMCFTGADGKLRCVDKTFAFNRDEEGTVVIVTHHSSKTIKEDDSTRICQNNEFGPRCDEM
jgi:hypothetical protein